MRGTTYNKIRAVAMYVNKHKDQLNDKKYALKENLNEVAAQLFIDELKASNKNLKTRNYKENFYVDIPMTREQIIGLLQVMETIWGTRRYSSENLNTLLVTDGIINSLLLKHPQLSKIFLYHSSFFEGFTVKNKDNEKIIDASSNNKMSDFLHTCQNNYCDTYLFPTLSEGELYKVTIILGKSFSKSAPTIGNEEYFHDSLKSFIKHIDMIPSCYSEFIFIHRILNFGLQSIDQHFRDIVNKIRPQGRDNQTYITENIFFLSNLFNIYTFLEQYLLYTPKFSDFIAILSKIIQDTPEEKILVELVDLETTVKIGQKILDHLLNPGNNWSTKYIGTILEETI